jgi:hypothetical protein
LNKEWEGFRIWEKVKTPEASDLFERIAAAEPAKWLQIIM